MPADSPYEPPKSSLIDAQHGEITRKGRHVIHKANVEWPSRCFKCNEETNLKKEVKLTYINPWIYLSILITPLITIILALIFRKRFTVNLPICEHHMRKRKHFLLFQWALLAITTAGFVVGGMTDMEFLLVISILLVLVVVISAIFGRLVFAAKYKNENIWVTGAGKSFLNSLPNFVA